MNIPNYHIIKVKYLGPTNCRGSRVKMTSDRFRQSITIPFNYSLNNIEDMAVAYLEHKNDPNGFNIIGTAEGYVITDTFKGLKG